ncbi:MAG: hypothetical protein RLZZ230_286 [Candidatus Parcubacteria bacterium]|jgi:ADP-ribose pyrophosphatase YjhB (NUDIX family)
MQEIPECYYRVSIKALILNETRDKFLICKEESGVWELPGGGLEWGATPQEDLPREIAEEMGLETLWVAEHPSYFVTRKSINKGIWVANILYEAEVEHYNFTPSDECVEIKFVNEGDLKDLNVILTVTKLAKMFKPEKHKR